MLLVGSVFHLSLDCTENSLYFITDNDLELSSFSGQVIKKTKTKGTLIDYYRMFLVDLGLACITSNSRFYYFYKVILADLSEKCKVYST